MPEAGQIIVERIPNASILALFGEHDIATAPDLRTELDALIATGTKVIVDLSEATFIDSSVVSALFHAAANSGRIAAIAAPRGSMPRHLIDMVALSASVPTFVSRAAAVAHATTGADS